MSPDPVLAWLPAPISPVLGPVEIHLWRFSLTVLDREYANLRSLLSADEVTRADRLLRPADGHRFAVGRGRLRQILSRYLTLAPADIALTTLSHGKPVLATPLLSFNLAHSGDLALLAIARSGDLGIDLEKLQRDFVWAPLAERYFSAGERQSLLAIDPEQQPSAFFTLWTRKEAYLKALGSGFHRPLDSFEVSAPPAPAALLFQQGDPAAPTRWQLQDLSIGTGYQATLAYPAPRRRLLPWDLLPNSR